MNKLEGKLLNIKIREVDEILLEISKMISHLRTVTIEIKGYNDKSRAIS